MQDQEELKPPVEVPFELLSTDAFDGVIDDFILREGTDYGSVELQHETKRERIRNGLKSGRYKLVFDPNIESITLLTAEEFRKMSAR
jgi:uncharacterized protein YheU (UPF0270 family)